MILIVQFSTVSDLFNLVKCYALVQFSMVVCSSAPA